MIKLIIIFGAFLLILSAGMVIKDWDSQEDVKLMSEDDIQEQLNKCPSFNGQKFLTSGGSKTPTNSKEIQDEFKRLHWLCNGGE